MVAVAGLSLRDTPLSLYHRSTHNIMTSFLSSISVRVYALAESQRHLRQRQRWQRRQRDEAVDHQILREAEETGNRDQQSGECRLLRGWRVGREETSDVAGVVVVVVCGDQKYHIKR